MKILKESREELPLSFITDFISSGWETVGYLKADIEAISETYKGTKEISKYIQDLADAYLICIGQMQNLLQENDYIDFPDANKQVDEKASKLAEDVQLVINIPDETVKAVSKAILSEPAAEANPAPQSAVETEPLIPVDEEEAECYSYDCCPEKPVVKSMSQAPSAETFDSFEYFVDFDEPDMSMPVDPDFFDKMAIKTK